jgi:Mn2+/Fe2+ NRAMP family transporter
VADGLIPRFDGVDSVLLATAMLGATVMPHAVYLHSGLARDRHGHPEAGPGRVRLLRATRWDVGIAMLVAGSVNLALLLVAATNLRGRAGTDTIEGAHAAVADTLGPVIALFFAIGLLASGLASTSVGAYAGAMIMQGLLRTTYPPLVRRLVTLVPALLVLASGVDPTRALVLSQVVLSFGIPFALVPLVRLTGNRAVMGADTNSADHPAQRCADLADSQVGICVTDPSRPRTAPNRHRGNRKAPRGRPCDARAVPHPCHPSAPVTGAALHRVPQLQLVYGRRRAAAAAAVGPAVRALRGHRPPPGQS